LKYQEGEGVLQDYVQAVAWWRKAAKQGHDAAQVELGLMYEKGEGVPQDYMQAYMWFNLAASRAALAGDAINSIQWAVQRDEVAAKMTPEQIAEAQRMAREWKPTK
jgi:TPR repeat protein